MTYLLLCLCLFMFLNSFRLSIHVHRVEAHVRSVVGMQELVSFLSARKGENIVRFWMDCARILSVVVVVAVVDVVVLFVVSLLLLLFSCCCFLVLVLVLVLILVLILVLAVVAVVIFSSYQQG
jgi:hypothetical protein